MPTVAEALQQLERELSHARQTGGGVLKLIHGYGSSGAGGEIRIAAQKRLKFAPVFSAKTGPNPTSGLGH
jgi:hypothetical protein